MIEPLVPHEVGIRTILPVCMVYLQHSISCKDNKFATYIQQARARRYSNASEAVDAKQKLTMSARELGSMCPMRPGGCTHGAELHPCSHAAAQLTCTYTGNALYLLGRIWWGEIVAGRAPDSAALLLTAKCTGRAQPASSFASRLSFLPVCRQLPPC